MMENKMAMALTIEDFFERLNKIQDESFKEADSEGEEIFLANLFCHIGYLVHQVYEQEEVAPRVPLTAKHVLQALKNCRTEDDRDCPACPYYGDDTCIDDLYADIETWLEELCN